MPNSTEASKWFEKLPESEGDTQVRMLLITKLPSPPLFLAALSVKFAGRVRFGLLQVVEELFIKILFNLNIYNLSQVKNKDEEEVAKAKLGVKDRAAYVLSTPQGSYHYGFGREEHLDFKTMHNFLRAVQPEANDALLVSLALCQLLAMIKAAPKRSLLGCLLTILAHNLALLAAWLAILTLSRYVFPLFCKLHYSLIEKFHSAGLHFWLVPSPRPFLVWAAGRLFQSLVCGWGPTSICWLATPWCSWSHCSSFLELCATCSWSSPRRALATAGEFSVSFCPAKRQP